MTVISIEEAQAKLSQLIDQLAPGEELVITRHEQPVAQLVGLPTATPRPVPGRGRGKLIIVFEDQDHLEAFKGYMPGGCSSTPIPCSGFIWPIPG